MTLHLPALSVQETSNLEKMSLFRALGKPRVFVSRATKSAYKETQSAHLKSKVDGAWISDMSDAAYSAMLLHSAITG